MRGDDEGPSESHSSTRYIPSLDGLRALAVLAVIAYHFGLVWAPGGLLGVTVFFVLSGYLITGLLLNEWRRTKRIDLKAFWMRRVRRLVPAIIVLLVCITALFSLFNHELLTKMRPDILPSLLFYSNWHFIFQDVSYFEALGAPSPLTHFWSLAIEEQFYIAWPLLLLFLFKRKTSKKTLIVIISAMIILSSVEMALLYDPMVDPSRVYYGTDTRAFSLLIGALLAIIWSEKRIEILKDRLPSSIRPFALDLLGAVALLGLVVMMGLVSGFSSFSYYGGILLASLLTAILVAALVHPKSYLAKAFSLPPFVWVGKRSYGIYLWHYPVILFMNPPGSLDSANPFYLLLQLVIIGTCAALSYHFIEDPIRKGAIGRFIEKVRTGKVQLSQYVTSHVIPIACSCVLVVGAGMGLALVPETYGIGHIEELKQATEEHDPINDQAFTEPEAVDETPNASVILIGDSVSAGAITVFEEVFPDGIIDSQVNRNIWEGTDVFLYYNDLGVVGDTLVFALGSNNAVVDWQIDDLIAPIDPQKQIYLVNIRSHLQDAMTQTNATFADAEKRFENIHVIDWYAASAAHEEYFDGDGTHLNAAGAQAYIATIKAALPQDESE